MTKNQAILKFLSLLYGLDYCNDSNNCVVDMQKQLYIIDNAENDNILGIQFHGSDKINYVRAKKIVDMYIYQHAKFMSDLNKSTIHDELNALNRKFELAMCIDDIT